MQILLSFATLLLRCVLAFFRGRGEQAIVELALRQQLAAYAQARPRPRLTSLDRAFWVALFRLWPRWKAVTGRRQARDRGPLAPLGLPPLLASPFSTRARTAARPARSARAHPSSRAREWLEGAEDPRRALEDRRNPVRIEFSAPTASTIFSFGTNTCPSRKLNSRNLPGLI